MRRTITWIEIILVSLGVAHSLHANNGGPELIPVTSLVASNTTSSPSSPSYSSSFHVIASIELPVLQYHEPTPIVSADAPARVRAGPATGSSLLPSPSSNTRPPVPQITGCRTQGQIAVTYSEGPSDATARIARQLNNADARANFFINASWLYTQQYAMVVQNIYNAGHFIGMAYRVKNDDSSALTEDEIRKDIIAHARMIETLIKVSPKYVRLHYTKNEDTRTENILKDLGFQIVGYNLDSKDYQFRDPTGEASVEHVYRSTFRNQKETYDAKGSFISIQYDIPDTGSLAAVPYIINAINEEGYTMVRLDGCLNDPQPYKKSADSTSYVSDRFSYNTTGYHQGQKAVPLDELKTQADEQGKSASPNASSVIPKWLYLLLVPWITVITI